MQDLYSYDSDYAYTFGNRTDTYDFVDGIPKSSLFVKLNPAITDAQRTYVANGIRNFF